MTFLLQDYILNSLRRYIKLAHVHNSYLLGNMVNKILVYLEYYIDIQMEVFYRSSTFKNKLAFKEKNVKMVHLREFPFNNLYLFLLFIVMEVAQSGFAVHTWLDVKTVGDLFPEVPLHFYKHLTHSLLRQKTKYFSSNPGSISCEHYVLNNSLSNIYIILIA